MEQEVCTISEECFSVPARYRIVTRGRGGIVDEEEQLLQLAIRQSLLDQGGGGEGGGEVRKGERPLVVEGPVRRVWGGDIAICTQCYTSYHLL